MASRLTMALDGGLTLSSTGTIAVFSPTRTCDLSPLPADRLRIVQPFRPDFDHFAALGHDCAPLADAETRHAAALVVVPRARAQARALIHAACACTSGPVIVDGDKTDGIDSLLREVRARIPVQGPLSKAHGKVFWFTPSDPAPFADWAAAPVRIADGFTTAPGVFSADGIDPASALLGDSLPAKIGRHVVDLGAGWGYLATRILADARVETLDLVEADDVALRCARANVGDPRARFHWADATRWSPDTAPDAVVMNPPFHVGRRADPALGRAFVATAARILAPGGTLWMVANRHLPYEAALAGAFATVRETAGDNRFKVLRAQRPSRPRR